MMSNTEVADWLFSPLAATCCGILAHHAVFIRGEWHLAGPQVVVGHLILSSLLWAALALRTQDMLTASGLHLKLLLSYTGSLFSSMAIYRLFFHRLSSFSGPRWAALTKFWHVWQCRGLKNYLVLHDVYLRHGEIVRTGKVFRAANSSLTFQSLIISTLSGPNEITIYRPEAIELIEKSAGTTRSEWYDVLHPKNSPVFQRNELEHMRRRRLWSQAMSMKCM